MTRIFQILIIVLLVIVYYFSKYSPNEKDIFVGIFILILFILASYFIIKKYDTFQLKKTSIKEKLSFVHFIRVVIFIPFCYVAVVVVIEDFFYLQEWLFDFFLSKKQSPLIIFGIPIWIWGSGLYIMFAPTIVMYASYVSPYKWINAISAIIFSLYEIFTSPIIFFRSNDFSFENIDIQFGLIFLILLMVVSLVF